MTGKHPVPVKPLEAVAPSRGVSLAADLADSRRDQAANLAWLLYEEPGAAVDLRRLRFDDDRA